MLRTIRTKETRQIIMVAVSGPNKWVNMNNIRYAAGRYFRNKSGNIERQN
jgi:hypothetical protein